MSLPTMEAKLLLHSMNTPESVVNHGSHHHQNASQPQMQESSQSAAWRRQIQINLNHELSLTLTELTDLNFKSRNLNSMTWSAMEGSVTFLTCLSNNSRTKCSSIFLEDNHSILVVLGQGYRQLKIIVNEIMCWYMHDTKEDSARVTQVLD